MLLPFADRPPTDSEIERLRLILSTYQDGSGMLAPKRGHLPIWMTHNNAITLPGWRDFERVVAATFGGIGTESKFIYDVILKSDKTPAEVIGISCKMRKELTKMLKKGQASIEVANASGEFWDTIKQKTNLTEADYMSQPERIGAVLLGVVGEWHRNADSHAWGQISAQKSLFLNLLWNDRTGDYRLLQFPIQLPDPSTLTWSVDGRRLIGRNESDILFEWYGHSGGQLKYYPPISQAVWISENLRLEPLQSPRGDLLVDKAAAYFPEKWPLL
jgi:hypothetical protein